MRAAHSAARMVRRGCARIRPGPGRRGRAASFSTAPVKASASLSASAVTPTGWRPAGRAHGKALAVIGADLPASAVEPEISRRVGDLILVSAPGETSSCCTHTPAASARSAVVGADCTPVWVLLDDGLVAGWIGITPLSQISCGIDPAIIPTWVMVTSRRRLQRRREKQHVGTARSLSSVSVAADLCVRCSPAQDAAARRTVDRAEQSIAHWRWCRPAGATVA